MATIDMLSDSEASFAMEESDDDFEFGEENIAPTNKKASSKKMGSAGSKKSTAKESKKEPVKASKPPASKRSKKTLEETYKKMTQLEHILVRPDTYVGSVEPDTRKMYVSYDNDSIVSKEVQYTPGLFKIYDEILVNAADNAQRDMAMDRLEVEIDASNNVLSVKNNGVGIPVQIHKEHDMYIPTMIFGHLLTSSNYDDDEKKTTGGRNGYGAKLANIFSKEFTVECVDTINEKYFSQTWNDNMSSKKAPKIRKTKAAEQKKGDYVCIKFVPDLEKFGMVSLDNDTVALLQKRAIDIAGSLAGLRPKGSKKLSVFLNGSKIPVKTFKDYLTLYPHLSSPKDILAYERDDRWEVAVGVSDGTFTSISFVNGINTSKGGAHVNYIVDQVTAHLSKALAKKHKSAVKAAQIKNHLHIACNCLIENPAFDSQTKETLTTKSKKFGSEFKLSDKALKSLEKGELADAILSYAAFKQKNDLKKKSGTKKMKLSISKLDDANFAGGAKSHQCTLILTEGDSAKSLAMSGLSVVGRDTYGVFPLKGKPLNVRDAPLKNVLANEELKNLVDIMGLKYQTVYTPENIKTLRYGHLMIMADQDHDGSHIKGLIINYLHFYWPSLLDIPYFLQCFITPIVKCTNKRNKKDVLTFFNLPEYENWRESGANVNSYSVKYYKGLGTSTSAEAKDYFSNLDLHEVQFSTLANDDGSQLNMSMISYNEDGDINLAPAPVKSGGELIEMAFSKKKVEERKTWLNSYRDNTFLNYDNECIKYSSFINKELILFSRADNTRSIPHLFDGFKPSQRKVLFACFKRNLKNEVKVAQLAGYIGEISAYHHGEASLAGTIVGMAQNFVGSNNINLLEPAGQFGTRRMGGKDSASARYIFTRLEKITRKIFHPDDDELLTYLEDDGQSIEPEYYLPVIPMILVNGSEGIGTGWSTSIPNHNPREVIANIRRMINDEEVVPMKPWYHGYTGDIVEANKSGSYDVQGRFELVSDSELHITELPLKKWTQDYKQFLETLEQNGDRKNEKEPDVKTFVENHTDVTVSFTVTTSAAKIDEFNRAKGGIFGKLKLAGKLSTTNMQLFNEDAVIQKFETPTEIMKTFFEKRLDFYVRRKALLLQKLHRQERMLSNKARFVLAVCEGDLIVNNRKKAELLSELKEIGYELFSSTDHDESEEDNDDLAAGYSYLLNMKIWSLTYEKVEELKAELADTQNRVQELENTTEQNIWLKDLDELEEALDERDAALEGLAKDERNAKKKTTKRNAKKKKKTVAAKKQKKKKGGWDSDALSDSSEDEASIGDEFLASKTQRTAAKKRVPLAEKKVAAPTRKKATEKASILNAKTKQKIISVEQSSDEEIDGPPVSLLERLKQKKSSKKAFGSQRDARGRKIPGTAAIVVDTSFDSSNSSESNSGKKRASPRAAVLNINSDESDNEKPAAKPAAAKKARRKGKDPIISKKNPVVKAKEAESSHDESMLTESDDEVVEVAPRTNRRGRARATVDYAAMVDDSGSEANFSEEEFDSDF